MVDEKQIATEHRDSNSIPEHIEQLDRTHTNKDVVHTTQESPYREVNFIGTLPCHSPRLQRFFRWILDANYFPVSDRSRAGSLAQRRLGVSRVDSVERHLFRALGTPLGHLWTAMVLDR